jgi:membrane protease YdiL (CAAX protease family)
MRALRPRQAWLLFVVGGVFAQAIGLLSAGAIAVALAASRGDVDSDAIAAASESFAVIAGAILGVGVGLVAGALLAVRLAKLPFGQALGLGRPRVAAVAAACVGVLGLGPVADLLVTSLERVLPRLTFGTLGALNEVATSTPLWMLLPLLAIVPGVAEELFFRGAFQRAFGAGAKAVVLSGIAFALFHVDPHHAVGVLPLGMFLAWTAARTSCVWVPVIAHVANNSLSIALVKLQGSEASEPGRITAWWVALVGVAVTAIAVLWLRRTTPSPTP